MDGAGSEASTWVVEVQFTQVPDLTNVNQLLGLMADKQFHFGIAQIDINRFLMVCTSYTSCVSSSCKTTLTRIFRTASLQAQIGQIVALNQYHLELFGISPPPTYAEEDPEEELNDKEQDELGAVAYTNLTLPRIERCNYMLSTKDIQQYNNQP